jgi:hypothetical protein
MWNHYPKNLGRAEVWSAGKFANPWAAMTMEDLSEKDAKQAITITEKDEMPKGESFPPIEHDQYFKLPPAAQAHQSGSKQAVEQALFSQSIRIAPGQDKLSFGAVHLLWKWDKEGIVEVPKSAIQTG